MNALEHFESVVQSSVLRPAVVFDRIGVSEVFDEAGNRYVDFSGGGYGHSNEDVREGLIGHLASGRLLQSYRATALEQRFVQTFTARILQPRNLHYRIMFTEPGSAIDVALRLARSYNRRSGVVAFARSSHGVADGSLLYGRTSPDRGPYFSRYNTTFMPYCSVVGEDLNTIRHFRRYLEDSTSGLDLPAAVIVESVQVNGGVRIASSRWLEALGAMCAEFGILPVVDDSLTGCGATGSYFGFEHARVSPDVVVVSNAIAAGLPMSVLLLRPDLNVRRAEEGMRTSPASGLAFAAATALLAARDILPSKQVAANSKLLSEELGKLAARHRQSQLRVRGKGMIWGLDLGRPGAAAIVSAWALERGVIVEPARVSSDVLLVRPAVTIDETTLREGLDGLDEAVSDFLSHPGPLAPRPRTTRQISSIAHQSVTKPK